MILRQDLDYSDGSALVVIPKAWVSEQSSKFVLDDKSSESLIPS
jgi:hypothetical protein